MGCSIHSKYETKKFWPRRVGPRAGERIMPKRNKRDSQQHTDEEKSSSSAALSNDASWNQRAWRRAGFLPLDRNLVADRALAVAARTSAVTATTTTGESTIHVQIHSFLCDRLTEYLLLFRIEMHQPQRRRRRRRIGPPERRRRRRRIGPQEPRRCHHRRRLPPQKERREHKAARRGWE